MKKNFSAKAFAFSFLCALGFNANAFEINLNNIHAGGGLGFNAHDHSEVDSTFGYQVFAGYDLSDDIPLEHGIGLLTEAGWTSSGEFTCNTNISSSCNRTKNGLWGSALVDYPIQPQLKILARAGLEFGDDSGLFVGFGAGYNLNREFSVRGEYVIRPNYSSAQGNIIFHF